MPHYPKRKGDKIPLNVLRHVGILLFIMSIRKGSGEGWQKEQDHKSVLTTVWMHRAIKWIIINWLIDQLIHWLWQLASGYCHSAPASHKTKIHLHNNKNYNSSKLKSSWNNSIITGLQCELCHHPAIVMRHFSMVLFVSRRHPLKYSWM